MINATLKPEIVKMFLRGRDIADVSVYFGCSQGTVQRLLREAITGLSELNQALAERVIAATATVASAPAIPANIEGDPAAVAVADAQSRASADCSPAPTPQLVETT